MRKFLTCLAEAITEKGLRGLAELVPCGPYLLGVAEGTFQKYRARSQDAQQWAEIQALAQATFDEVRAAAAEAVRTAAPNAPSDDALSLELYLTQVPGTVRRSLVRPDDATGTTVPAGFSLRSIGDVVRLLPGHPPRFRPGNGIPGLDGWTLIRLLGSGGFGEVWLARGRRAGKDLGAVKFCHPERVAELRNEAQVIRRVRRAGAHANIVELLSSDLSGDAPWLLYEYVTGEKAHEDLSGRVRALRGVATATRVEGALGTLRELCPAVAHFHALDPAVVHRDLKPANILVDARTGTLKITDFGIGAVTAAAGATGTRFADASASERTAFLRGAHSALYASPQQRAGEPPDPRDDVHALGVIAYQLLTAQLTRGPGTDFADDLRDVGVGPALVALVGSCVAHNPVRRPADAGELLDRVREIRVPSEPPPVTRATATRSVSPIRTGDRAPRPGGGDFDTRPEDIPELALRRRQRAKQARRLREWTAIGGVALFALVCLFGIAKKFGQSVAPSTPEPQGSQTKGAGAQDRSLSSDPVPNRVTGGPRERP